MDEPVVVYETDLWKIILSFDQYYLGRCIIVLKRDCGRFSELTHDEINDFFYNIVKKLEHSLKEAFGATMFNWTCLMNNAYKEHPPHPWVHWHFRPRYDHNVNFEGETFMDLEFGKHYARQTEKQVSHEMMEKIAEEIRKHL